MNVFLCILRRSNASDIMISCKYNIKQNIEKKKQKQQQREEQEQEDEPDL